MLNSTGLKLKAATFNREIREWLDSFDLYYVFNTQTSVCSASQTTAIISAFR